MQVLEAVESRPAPIMQHTCRSAARFLKVDTPPDGAIKPIKHLSQTGLHPLQLQRLLLCTVLLSLLRENPAGDLCLCACKRHKARAP